MRYNDGVHHRRSMRLPGYDYSSAGAYFVTICSRGRECIYDDPRFRGTADEVWRIVVGTAGPLDAFVVMPNHVHGIIWIAHANVVGAQQPCRPNAVSSRVPASAVARDDMVAAPLRTFALAERSVVSGSLGAIVRSFKSAVAKRINNIRGTPGAPIWQRNYYEHIIRKEAELNEIRRYILDNPRRWDEDPENPASVG